MTPHFDRGPETIGFPLGFWASAPGFDVQQVLPEQIPYRAAESVVDRRLGHVEFCLLVVIRADGLHSCDHEL